MADWMNDMANAVEEAEAAQARAQEEVPTEPAVSPRDSVLEVPINDGQWTADEYAKISSFSSGMPVTHDPYNGSGYPATDIAEAAFNNRHKLLNMKHTNEVSENGMLKSKLEGWMLHHFQAVHLRKVLHPSVYFHKSMRSFDRMLQVLLLIHSQL